MNTLKIVVGSRNPVKINAARSSFEAMYPDHTVECTGIDAPSGVPDQPMDEHETREGAVNRVNHCRQHEQADFYVAMEGGVDEFVYGPCTFAYVVVGDKVSTSIGRSASLPLPEKIFAALKAGEELGSVMDREFNVHNIKQKGGAIGLLTNGLESREGAYTQALTLAMARFLHPEIYAQKG